MPVSNDRLASIIGRAQRLCNPEGDKLVHANIDQTGFNRQLDESYVPDPKDYDADAAKWDSLYSDNADEDYARPAVGGGDMYYSKESVARSGLPDAIKKSMMEQQIDRSALGNNSVLDGLNIKPAQRVTAAMQKKAVIAEGGQRQQPSYQPQVGGVDYSVIKAIVSECIREYFSSPQMINENTLSQIHLSGGTISLVDNKGYIYRAKLERIGTTNNE